MFLVLSIKASMPPECNKVCVNSALFVPSNVASWNLHDLLKVAHVSVQQVDLDRPCHDHVLCHFQTLASEWLLIKVQWYFDCNVHGMIRESNGQQRKSKRKDIHGGRWQQKQKANISLEQIKATLWCYSRCIAIWHVEHNFLYIVSCIQRKYHHSLWSSRITFVLVLHVIFKTRLTNNWQ